MSISQSKKNQMQKFEDNKQIMVGFGLKLKKSLFEPFPSSPLQRRKQGEHRSQACPTQLLSKGNTST